MTGKDYNLRYFQTAYFAVLCLSCGVTGRVQRKKRGIVEGVMSSLKSTLADIKLLCDDCHSIAMKHKLDNLTIDKVFIYSTIIINSRRVKYFHYTCHPS